MATAQPDSLRFGRFDLRPAQRQLLIDGHSAVLGSRAFDVLLALIERRDRVVSKDELLDAVWAGLVVEENNLQVQISSLRKLLGSDAIVTIPGRGYRFVASIEGSILAPAVLTKGATDSSTRLVSDRARGCGIPAERMPTLIGREADQTAVQALIRQYPLVTIVGPGGIGKTVLAASVAYAGTNVQACETAWVELAPLSDPSLISPTVAAAVGVELDSSQELLDALVRMLRCRSMLIVLDNAEHLIAAVAEVADALTKQTREVHLLVTSRAPLKLVQEQTYRLDALAVPTRNIPAQQAAKFGAVALFVARAHSLDRRFELSDRNASLVVDVCGRLDGIPLAIELAATRARTLGLTALAAMIEKRFDVLASGTRTAPSRHQTMLAAFDWSHDLLSVEQKTLFRRLAVFSGGFTLEAARKVAADGSIGENDVVDNLSALVDASLVFVDADDPSNRILLRTCRAPA